MSTRPPWEVDDRPPWEIEDDAPAAPTLNTPQGSFPTRPQSPSARPLSAWERVQQASTNFLSGVPDFVRGAAQEAPLVAMRAARVPGQVIRGGLETAADLTGLSQNPDVARALVRTGEQEQQVQQLLESPFQPNEDAGLAENLGRSATRIAPQVALGVATSGASIPIQAAVAGGAQGVQSSTEGASPGEIALSGGLAALGPPAGRLVGAGGRWLGRKAIEQYTRALNPTQRAGKIASQRIVPELLERGVTGNLDELANIGAQRSEDVGEQIARRYSTAARRGQRLDANQIADELEALKEPFIGRARDQAAAFQSATRTGPHGQIIEDPGRMALATQGRVVLDDVPYQAITDIQDRLRTISPDPENLWKLRRNLDNIVNQSNGFTRPISPRVAASIARDARSVLQRNLSRANPDVVALNEEYRLWQDLETIARETALRKTGQQGAAGMLARAGGGAAGAVVGAAGGPVGSVGGAMAGQQVTKGLTELMSSPAWRTVSAVQKAKLARLMTSSEPQRALDYMARLLAQQVPSTSPVRNYARDVEQARRARQTAR